MKSITRVFFKRDINSASKIGERTGLAGTEIEKAGDMWGVTQPDHDVHAIAYPDEIAKLAAILVIGVVRAEQKSRRLAAARG